MRDYDKDHKQFYAYFEKNYPEIVKSIGRKWTPRNWNSSYSYFNEDCSGFKKFLDVIPKDMKIKNIIFEFITESFDIDSFMKKCEKIVKNYWNKIAVCGNISINEERNFIDLFKQMKYISILNKYGKVRVSRERHGTNLNNISAEDFEVTELIPDIPEIEDKKIFKNQSAYIVDDNQVWWRLDTCDSLSVFGFLYFKSDNPKFVPQMKCTIVDNTFIAIPEDLMNNKQLVGKFNKLLPSPENMTNNKSKGKKNEKYSLTKLKKMNLEQLDKIVEEKDLYGFFEELNLDPYSIDDEDLYVETIYDALQEKGGVF